jgi:undecaprenyl-diphosphatase
MTWWEALVLGLVQGLTEFLPVSSSGHLEIGKALFGSTEEDLTFSVVVHAATALSTLFVFRNDIASLIRGFFQGQNLTDSSTPARSYIGWIVLSAIPAAAIGLTLRGPLEEAFMGHPDRVGMMLILTAGILLLAQRLPGNSKPLNAGRAVLIGLAQAFAILPGISRSGSTISASLMLGVSRKEAARFSFLMALPPILGAMLLEIPDVIGGGSQGTDWTTYAIGALAAFTSGTIACRWMIRLVQALNLSVFAAYCLTAGLLAMLFL